MTNGFDAPQATIEAGLLHSCLSIEQWLELGFLSDEDFSSHREIYQFFKEHISQFGNLPSQNIISTKFGWQPPIGEFQYWLKEMRRYSMARKILSVIQEGYNQVSDPEKALGTLLTELSVIRSSQSNHIKATDASALERLQRFDLRTENIFKGQHLIGVRTGLNIFDESLIGYIPGSLVGGFSRPGIGKTWWLMWSGVNAWMDGNTVLAITPEMPANLLNLRIDTVVGNALGYPIDYTKLMIGDPSIRDNYEIITKILDQSARWWTYDSVEGHSLSLGDLAGLIAQHKPDIVLVDGISLLHHEGRSQTWEQIKDLSYGLKNLATISEVPILVTHQAVNSGKGRRSREDDDKRSTALNDEFHMPSLNDAAFGDAFGQACSDVITFCSEPGTKHVIWYALRKTRERGWQKQLEPRYALAVDYALGKIYDLSQFGYNPAIVGQETKNLLGKF